MYSLLISASLFGSIFTGPIASAMTQATIPNDSSFSTSADVPVYRVALGDISWKIANFRNDINNGTIDGKLLASIVKDLNSISASYCQSSAFFTQEEIGILNDAYEVFSAIYDTTYTVSGKYTTSYADTFTVSWGYSADKVHTYMARLIYGIEFLLGDDLTANIPQSTPTPSVGVSDSIHNITKFQKVTPQIHFTDLSQSEWFYNDVLDATQYGIINGYEDVTFRPYGTLTHAEAITLAAKTYAIYTNTSSDLQQRIDNKVSDSHWVLPYYSFLRDKGVLKSDLDDSLFGEPCTRGFMAETYSNVLPEGELGVHPDLQIINDLNNAPEPLENYPEHITTLFATGIFIGNKDGGFRLDETITRAEAAAVILRVADPSRRAIEPPAESTPTPDTGTTYPFMQRTLYVNEAYHGIAPRITTYAFEGSSPINVLYNHTYNCANQQQYDAVIAAVKEAVAYANANYEPWDFLQRYMDGEITKDDLIKQGVFGGLVKTFYNDEAKLLKYLETYDRFMLAKSYLTQNYVKQREYDTSKESGISAYNELFGGTKTPTCVATANLYMALWDVMGYNSAVHGSTAKNHAVWAVQFDGIWFTYGDGLGAVSMTPTEEVKKVCPDLEVDVYETHSEDIYGYAIQTW